MQKARSVMLTSLVASRELESSSWRYPRLAIEGFAFTVAGILISYRWASYQGGIISVFLTAAALRGRLEDVLEDYRGSVVLRMDAGLSALRRLALALIALLVGVMTGYVLASLVLGRAQSSQLFGFALQVAKLGNDTLLTRSRPDLVGLLLSNTFVLITIFALSFIYRTYGAALALVWNGCIWSLVLSILVRRSLGADDNVTLVVLTAVATLPHLLIEGVAYLLTSVGAIFLSQQLPQVTGIEDPALRRELRRTGKVLALAVPLLVIAALLESTVWMPQRRPTSAPLAPPAGEVHAPAVPVSPAPRPRPSP